jgi:hypothetical protein
LLNDSGREPDGGRRLFLILNFVKTVE